MDTAVMARKSVPACKAHAAVIITSVKLAPTVRGCGLCGLLTVSVRVSVMVRVSLVWLISVTVSVRVSMQSMRKSA